MIALLIALFFVGAPAALEPAVDAPNAPTTRLSPGLQHPVLPLGIEALDALASRDHAAAVAALEAMDPGRLSGHQVGDHAFLLAWSLIRSDRGAEAVGMIDVVRSAEHVPASYLQLTVAELLRIDGQPAASAQALATIDPADAIWPRAALARAQALHDAGRTLEARNIYQEMIDRPDPASGSELALWALAKGAGLSSPEALPMLNRLWAWYPRHSEGLSAARTLSERGIEPSWRLAARRAERMMAARRYSDAIALGQRYGRGRKADADACLLWYAHGRSLFKKNRLTDAGGVLEPAGEKCAGHDDDSGAKALYLSGKARERKKDWAGAARVYRRLPVLYPNHTMADDGYALAGIARQEAGDLPGARELWAEQVARYPAGDLAGEGFWRLAWGAYLAGDTPTAIRWAERMLDQVPLRDDPTRLRAAAYWAARWKAWPYIDAPELLNSDAAAIAEGAQGLLDILRESPWTYYAALAASRLEALEPGLADTVPLPTANQPRSPWEVRTSFLAEPAVANGIALNRLGLYQEAMAEFKTIGDNNLSPTELAFIIELQQVVDPLASHDRFRRYFNHHPPEEITRQREQVMRVAWPLRWWGEVQDATTGYAWDPRVFHGLVREESNFNPRIVSHAGARGLSQLMPPTARSVAGWMGMTVSKSAMFDPATNLKIGARYLDFLIEDEFGGNWALALAGYNAGQGNVRKWLGSKGNLPTDEFVESIPFRETRHYVKRVSDSFLTYRLLYAPESRWPDLGPYLYVARPD
jgi:soluble lytic murein transglycosylase